jgi:hypothetical protein
MTKPLRKGAEEARNQLPELLTAAQRGPRLPAMPRALAT